MRQPKNTPEVIICAAVDGEVDAQEIAEIQSRPDAMRYMHDLRQISQDIKLAYEDIDNVVLASESGSSTQLKFVAGGLILVGAVFLGFFLRDLTAGPVDHLLLHVTRGDEASMMAAMEVIETSLAKGIAIDLMTQRDGLSLLNIDSPVAARLHELAGENPNLHIFACAGTLEKLRDRGGEPMLIADALTDTRAVDQLSYAYEHRWRYQRL